MNNEFDMQYQEYDLAIAKIIECRKDFEIITYIKNLFLEKEIKFIVSIASRDLKTSKRKIYEILSLMIENKILFHVSILTFRLNPYMIIPFGFNGEDLQKEWDELIKNRKKEIKNLKQTKPQQN